MKKNTVNYRTNILFAILFVLACIAGIFFYFRFVSEYSIYQINTTDSVSGLIVDAPVEFHGVEVGKVTRIKLINPKLVSVLFSVNKTVPITQATVATITARGLAARGFTGYVYIALEDIGTDFQPLLPQPGKPYPIIATRPAKLENLDASINQMNKNVQQMTAVLKVILDKKTILSLKEVLQNLQLVTTTLVKNNDKLISLINNMQQASTKLDPLLNSSTFAVQAIQTQLLPQLSSTISNLNDLTNSITSVTTKISQNPSVLIRGTAALPPGPGEH